MKKFIGKIGVVVLALAMFFSLGACGTKKDDGGKNNEDDNIVKVNTVSQAYDGALEKLLSEDGFTVKINAAESGKKYTGSFAAKKADGSYDFKLSGKKDGDANETVFALKKGNIIYTPDREADGYYQTGYTEITAKEIADELGSAVSEMSDDGTLSYADGIYTVDYGKTDYSDIFKSVQTFLVQNKNVKLGEFVAGFLGDETYTGEELYIDLDKIFAEDPVLGYASVGSFIAGLNTFAGHALGLPVSIDLVADMLLSQYGITAQEVYALFVQLGIADEDNNVPAPEQTPYEYFYSVCKDFPLNDVIAQAVEFFKLSFGMGTPDMNAPEIEPAADEPAIDEPEQGLDYVALIRAKIDEIFGEDGWTVGDFYNNTLDFIGNVAGKLLADKVDPEQINTAIGFIKLPAFEKLEFGENSFSAKVELNAQDLSFKRILLTADNNVSVNMPTGSVPVLKIDVDIEITFDYDSAVEITAPTQGIIEPCMPGEIDADDLPQSGSFEIPVFAGNGFTFSQPECLINYEPIDGVSYANGKITLTEAAIAEIRAAKELDAEIVITLSTALSSDNEKILILECTID